MRIPTSMRSAVVGVTCLLLASVASAASTDAATILKELGFPADSLAQVEAGKMVETDLKSSDERELAVGLAFLVKQTPAQFVKELQEGLLTKVDANVEAHGTLTGDGTVDQLAGLKLGDLASKYSDAKRDGDLNLSAAEISALAALKGKPESAIEDEVRRQLLARYQAYRRSGLDGIAPYARGSGERSGAADLRSAVEAASVVKQLAANFHDTLLNYPNKPAAGFHEAFTWQRYMAHGTPTVILTHGFTIDEGDAFGVCQRQYYVSTGYNVEQAIAGLLPVSEGTLVVYVNRTSTDQVAGFGGGAKRSIGEKVMASQLHDLFTKLQQAADQ